MESPYERKMKANDLRKSRKFDEALVLYKDLHNEVPDQYTSAGYLHCLRKLKKFDEAIPLANTLVGKYAGFDWVTTEIVWTYIEGQLNQIPEEESLTVVISIANKILQQQPNQLASNLVNMRVCKIAKSEKNWKLLNEWIQKIDPQSLDHIPMKLPNGREGWSQQSLWYLYRSTSLIEDGASEEAFPFLSYALENFPKHRKFFVRLRAQAYARIGKKEDALADYRELCNLLHHPDWWILKEYADVLVSLDRYDEALDLLYQAAQDRQDPGMMVGLFESIGDLLSVQGKSEQAALHYQLSKLIREDRGWKIPDNINEKLTKMMAAGMIVPQTFNEALQLCKKDWAQSSRVSEPQGQRNQPQDGVKRDITGKISLGRSDQTFCFINLDDGGSVFCSKDHLPPEIKHGDQVILDARPSWDKKKNRQGWKAQNVRIKKV